MKTIILLASMLTAPFYSGAQNSPFLDIYEKYYGQDGYTTISVSKHMFELFAKIEPDEDSQDFHEVVSGLEGIKVLTTDGDNAKGLYKEAKGVIPSGKYKELMEIKEGDEEILFYINEKDGKISELVMILDGDEEAVIMTLFGTIDLAKISKLSHSMRIHGMEHLDKVHEHGKSQ